MESVEEQFITGVYTPEFLCSADSGGEQISSPTQMQPKQSEPSSIGKYTVLFWTALLMRIYFCKKKQFL